MSDADIRQRFLFPDSDIRGEIVRLEASLAPAMQARDYPLAVQSLLSEALAAVVLMTSSLKFTGRLALQARGSGALSLLLAESTDDGQIRGLAQCDNSADMAEGLSGMLGDDGLMAITIKPERGNQYQGVVPLQGDTLASSLESYFTQSEQLPTRLWLAAGNGRAAGVMLQALPDRVADHEHNEQVWQHVTTLADTLTMEELLDLPADTVLHRLFHEEPPELPPTQSVRFGCTCSRERVINSLISLGINELKLILEEDKQVQMTCDFCQNTELLDAVDLDQLIRSMEGD